MLARIVYLHNITTILLMNTYLAVADIFLGYTEAIVCLQDIYRIQHFHQNDIMPLHFWNASSATFMHKCNTTTNKRGGPASCQFKTALSIFFFSLLPYLMLLIVYYMLLGYKCFHAYCSANDFLSGILCHLNSNFGEVLA